VKETSARRSAAGHDFAFCCESCARYFSEHTDRVLTVRGITPR
jgi:hypothetical protein